MAISHDSLVERLNSLSEVDTTYSGNEHTWCIEIRYPTEKSTQVLSCVGQGENIQYEEISEGEQQKMIVQPEGNRRDT